MVSVIVPVYKVEPWLEKCLDSLATQTFSDFECILVDDGSPDSCGVICDNYAAKDLRFKVVHKVNGGLSSARNAGLELAEGVYVAFCDSDDMYAPSTLEHAIQAQKQDSDGFVIWGLSQSWNGFIEAIRNGEFQCHKYSTLQWRQEMFRPVYTKLFDNNIIKEFKLRFDETLGRVGQPKEDIDFVLRYIEAHYQRRDFTVIHTDTPYYFYNQDHPGSLMDQYRKMKKDKEELPEPERDYCKKLLIEYEQAKSVMQEFSREEYIVGVRHYLRCLAYGVWSASKLQENLPMNFWNDPQLKELLKWCKINKVYSHYYVPFLLKFPRLISWIYELDEEKNINFWRVSLVFYNLFCRGWIR